MRLVKNNPLILFLLVSFLFWIVIVSINPFPTASLEGTYTDHLNYETAAWFFLQKGFDVFRTPLGELVQNCHALHPHATWGELPYDKTLGNLLFFMPFGAINNLGILPEAVANKLLVCLLILIAHIAIYYFVDELRNRHATLAIKATLSTIFYLSLLHWSANGLSDTISILFIILTIRFLREKRNILGLLCYVMSVFMHYRALYLFPLGIYALVNLYKERKLSLTSLLRANTATKIIYSFTIIIVALTIYTAWLSFIEFPYARVINEVFISSGRVAHNPLNPEFFSAALAIPVLAMTGLAVFYLVRERELLTAPTIAVAFLSFSLLPFFQTWYPLFLFPIPLIPNEERSRWVTLSWLLLTALILVVPLYSLGWIPETVAKWLEAL